MSIQRSNYPIGSEITIGVVAPIGADFDMITKRIQDTLEEKGYKVEPIKITDLIKKQKKKNTYNNSYHEKIERCNTRCAIEKRSSILAKYAIRRICTIRSNHKTSLDRNKPIAFLIDSLKRPDEILLLREVLGRAFFSIGITKSELKRRECTVLI